MKNFTGDLAFLSNSYVIEGGIEYEGVVYPSVENAFQAAKTLDPEERQLFETVSTTQARRHGQKVTMRDRWGYLRVNVMQELVWLKFQNPELREKLLATGDTPIEGTNSTHDNYWGACQCARCKGALGLNWLGRILMTVRKDLRAQPDPEPVAEPEATEEPELVGAAGA
jgi:N-glycosidase YbiA